MFRKRHKFYCNLLCRFQLSSSYLFSFYFCLLLTLENELEYYFIEEKMGTLGFEPKSEAIFKRNFFHRPEAHFSSYWRPLF